MAENILSFSEPLVARLAARLAGALRGRRELALPPLPGAAEAVCAWALARATGRVVVWIGHGRPALETFHRDLLTLRPAADATPLYFPAWDAVPGRDVHEDPDIAGHRLRALLRLAGLDTPRPAPCLLATSIQALLQATLPPSAVGSAIRRLAIGTAANLSELGPHLVRTGYRLGARVDEKGQASVRGGLLDVWPVTADWPLRIEFFDTDVESIRTFDPADQRSVAKVDEALIAPASEWSLLPAAAPGAPPPNLLAHLPHDAAFIWSEPDLIAHHAATFEETAAEAGADNVTLGLERIRTLVRDRGASIELSTGAFTADALSDNPMADVRAIPDGRGDSAGGVLPPDVLERARRGLLADLLVRADRGQTAVACLDTPGTAGHIAAKLAELEPDASRRRRVHIPVGVLSAGFTSEALGVALLAEPDLYGRPKQQGRRYDPDGPADRPAPAPGLRVTELTDVDVGDLVVHVEHGIGRYLGLNAILFNGQTQEVLTIEYAEGAKLHVPVSQAHLLSRYVTLARGAVPLHKLGGRRWSAEKSAAEDAIADLAAALLETQAARATLDGHAFRGDTAWQHEFETAFPYRETRDQHEAIATIKGDMEAPRPMDRLICGDAGYGKTEVAMRAAFKAVMEGKQVAVLVPTTVLAQQHYQTFAARMADYPVRIEMLSRFTPRPRRTATLRAMAEGGADIVIGTHALLQPGVRFRDLGLVIVDEEQRFGVAHKERFKQLRRLVDILTLTATPIPRTLYLSLTGARDMSLLQTPPLERMAIETVVTRSSDKVVREAVLRELNRGGQVFYLHNRVFSIDHTRARLQAVIPEARLEAAHGRMAAGELAAIMQRFVAGAFDVLVCTTIIESGMDIPRANTILIDRADRFGLADLYQLRGRVGRSNRKAYAYLLLPEHGRIDAEARQRIAALQRHTGLSVGFSLALRDLEIRGAGNILGAAQSGHIAAIGFGLYCQLLKRTVAQLKGAPLPPVIDVDVRLDFLSLTPDDAAGDGAAGLPFGYIEDEGLRVGIYRKFADVSTAADIESLRTELADRFGPLPPAAARLLKLTELRVACAAHGVRRAEARDGKVMLTGPRGYLMKNKRFPRLRGTTAEEQLDDIVSLVRGSARWADATTGALS